MYMSENLAVTANKDRVCRHAHVRLQVAGCFTVLVLDTETEPNGLLGFERPVVALPHHAVTVRERGHVFRSRQIGNSSIVAAEQPARDCRQIDDAYLRLRETGVVHDVGINLIASGRHARQVGGKPPGAYLVRMQMPEALHVRHAHQKQGHAMAAVPDEVVQAQAVRRLYTQAARSWSA